MKKVGKFTTNCTWCNSQQEHTLFIEEDFTHGMTTEDLKLHKKCNECKLVRSVKDFELADAHSAVEEETNAWLENQEFAFELAEKLRIEEEKAQRKYRAALAATAALESAELAKKRSSVSKSKSRTSMRGTAMAGAAMASSSYSSSSSYQSSDDDDYSSSSSWSSSSSSSSDSDWSSSDSYGGGSSDGGGCSSDW